MLSPATHLAFHRHLFIDHVPVPSSSFAFQQQPTFSTRSDTMNPSSVFFDARNPRDSCPGSPDVDVRHASDLLHRFSMAASDTSSARLTPSPHCSPGSSPKRRHLALDLSGDEAPASQSRAATNDPLDQFRYDPAREPTFPSAWGVGMGIDMPGSGGLGPWTVNVRATSGSSQSRWPFAQRSPA